MTPASPAQRPMTCVRLALLPLLLATSACGATLVAAPAGSSSSRLRVGGGSGGGARAGVAAATAPVTAAAAAAAAPAAPAAPAATDTAGSSIVASPFSYRQWWGFPNYVRELDFGPPTWDQLMREHGKLGRACSAEKAHEQCGNVFVCRDGFCSECAVSRDCGEKYRCEASDTPAASGAEVPFAGLNATNGGPLIPRMVCVARDLEKHWSWREVVCTVLVVLTAILSAAAGMGGGGVYVPLMLLLLGFSTKEAVPLSQAMIFGGALVNVLVLCRDAHPMDPSSPKINYSVVMMLNPGLAAGVTIGVVFHMISPQWLIVSVLLVTLVIALQKSLKKGLDLWKKESQRAAESQALALLNGSGGGADANNELGSAGGAISATHARRQHSKPKIPLGVLDLCSAKRRPIILITACWFTFLVLNLLKAPQCSLLYWLQMFGMIAVCVLFTVEGARTLREEASSDSESQSVSLKSGELAWTPRAMWLYPLLATVAGFLGGFLGIGGGIIMGPLLLELGLIPEVGQATTAMFVFLSSSIATIQFVVLDKAMPAYTLWFTIWVVIATFIGQTSVDYVLQHTTHSSSLIALSIAAIVAGSLVMMTIIGTMDTISDFQRGTNLGFTPHELCRG